MDPAAPLHASPVRALPPFRRLPFAALPERPLRPHPWLELPVARLRVEGAGAAGDGEAAFRRLGSGPPLLLVHGLMTSGYSFRYVVEPLARDFTVFVPDMPGAGDSARPRGGSLSADALAAWIAAFQRAAGIRGCVVLGNSMGGYLCLRLALADPATISRLVDVHSPGLPEARLWALRTALRLPGARALLSAMVARDPERWVWRNVHYRDERLKCREETKIYGATLATPDGRNAFASYLAETLDPRDMASLRRVLRSRAAAGQPFPVPTLLVYAREDPMVPPRIGPMLQALLPGSRLLWLDAASHFAHVDAPERLLTLIGPFLRGETAAGPAAAPA